MSADSTTGRTIVIREARSGLAVTARLLAEKAPENVAFLWAYLETPRLVPGLHAMWTGPEISCPIPPDHLAGAAYANPLPAENATLHPQPGDIVLAYVPARMWGGNPSPIFDIGLFYGPGARMFFPIGWLAGSVVAEIAPEQRAALAAACGVIRRNGACEISFARGEA
ncbi:DUF3830 family protein [Segnochrobactrum spirostomi]|uniref:DUF3830 family protein n=1 Tax=Segnochrobactrum spirostomi TaxID=2608987 RepID=A0A6A7Y1L2_9HYPH|nr:DUF3830 family protein [Segnochrobactrum spirostomi]MQT12576.1 DUF3830 family protein [Segnochrobactrum spirostomi]